MSITFYLPGVSVLIILVFIIVNFIKFRLFPKKCSSKVCLVGKTALVTGGSLGIGYEIVLGLAQRGCKVIIADKIVSNDIKNRIISETHNSQIFMEFVDLASFRSVRALAEKIKSREEKLDILINNAGIGESKGALSEDGLNLTMQVNYYSPFLISHLLIDLLKNSSSARLIFGGSFVALCGFGKSIFGRFLEHILGDYRLSKFCLLVITNIFAEKLEPYKITVNYYHPGAVNTQMHTQFFRNVAIISKLQKILGPIVFKSPEDGAQTAIYLACSNEVQNVSGAYFSDLKLARKLNSHINKIMGEHIWETSEKVVKLRKAELL